MTIKQLEEEKITLVEKVKKLDKERNEILIRLAEIQGVIKYITEEENGRQQTKTK